MRRLLVVEDDPTIAEPLARALRRDGYDVDVRADGASALARANRGDVDMVLLDLGLPDVDGMDVCRRLRAESPGLPILMLTARADELDTVIGLDAGADDYVTKPFRLAELLARVRAVMRRGQVESAVHEVRGITVDSDARKAWLGGTELQLTVKEFDLLRVLVRDAGRVVSRGQLMREVWGSPWPSSTKTLDMHMTWLRRKLGDDPVDSRYITTVRGVGFRFEPE
ncbi:MAG TPA: response regulator transcription factor [Actinomycetes bacterium]|jgi:DNA-binding response OmpR family regulator|nr:response regulator transcription factor [Actinomycetes bacterium]